MITTKWLLFMGYVLFLNSVIEPMKKLKSILLILKNF